ncbi:MAG: hypothetical protein OXB84_08875 [Halobacteriovoraceae bacterium]|nr:hypothetical protein [Halobacteriovoraceae bacterium]
MRCRVGITANLETRKAYWKRQYPNLTNWKILARGLSYSAAQKEENRYSLMCGCEAHAGGVDDGSQNWYVYRFDY